MRIGLCGSHRSGKTTLARRYAEVNGVPMIASSVSAIALRYDFDMDNDRRDDPAFREMQNVILDTLEKSFRGQSNFISDRTPLDAAAYLIADMQANTGSPHFQQGVLQYLDRARRLTNELFDTVVLVPPGISFEEEPGKPGGNLAYQEHHHLLVRALMSELDIKSGELDRENLSLDGRLDALIDWVDED
jgi:nicotinamide riboside kinase